MLLTIVVLLAIHCVESQNSDFPIQNVEPTSCTSPQYFDFGTLECKDCGTNMLQDSTGYTCSCQAGYKADITNLRVLSCSQCTSGATTPDGYYCATCGNVTLSGQCQCDTNSQLLIESYTNGNNTATCAACGLTGLYNTGELNCVPNPELECQNSTGGSIGEKYDNLCFSDTTVTELMDDIIVTSQPYYISQNLRSAYGACISHQFSLSTAIRNQTACEHLANMCVMEYYNQESVACDLYSQTNTEESFDITSGAAWQTAGIPWLYYSSTTGSSATIQTDTGITTSYGFNANTKLELYVARYRANGTFLGIISVEDGIIQLCKDKPSVMNAAYVFGTTFDSTCTLDASTLWNDEDVANIYYDMFLKFTDANNQDMLYPVPVLISNYQSVTNAFVNQGSNSDNWQFVRRFFLIDNIYGIPGDNQQATEVRYASSMNIQISLQSTSSGTIFPPILRMSYSTVSSDVLTTGGSVQTSFSTGYSSSTFDQNEGIKISMSVLGVLAFFYAVIETSGWRRRQGLPYIELTTLIQFVFFFMGNVANVFFIVMLGYTIALLIFFKGQNTATSYVPSNESYQNYLFMVFISTAFACKLVQVLVMIFKQAFVDIFLIDWERPRAKSADDGSNKISIWRTYFIANEWNEIQACRKINTTLQLFVVLFFLEVANFKNLALLNSSSDLNPSDDTYEPAYSNLLRFAVGGFVYVITAIVQVIYFKIIHERFISDKIRDFVDLCSMSNVSVFILSQNTFGYYIHGRSVHGKADTDMVEMNLMMQREGEDLVPKRGLVTGTETQVFEIMIPIRMRQQYDKVYQPLQLMRTQPVGRGPPGAAGGRGDAVVSESMKAYSTMKTFLTSFIDHSLRDLDYVVKEKLFLEKVVGIEFQEPVDRAFFTVGDDDAFGDILFYGREFALLVFDILLFSMVDYRANDFVLSAVITYIVGGILKIIRGQLGRHNLAKKTLIDKRFLI